MLDLTLFVFVIFLIFVCLAQMFKEAYVFAMSGFFSIIAGIALAIGYAAEPEAWAFNIIGFALFLFGFWLLAAAYELTLGK
jgi:hypothetical protein